MSFNPAASYSQGLQIGQQQKLTGLKNALSGQMQEQGFNPAGSAEFKQLSALDPAYANTVLNSFTSLDESRQKAFFQDAQKGLEFLNSGDEQSFIRLANDRLSDVERLGGDPSDIVDILQTYATGDIEGVKQKLGMAVNAGIHGGFLADPLDRELNRLKVAEFKNNPSGKSSNMRELDSLIGIAESDPNGETIRGKAALVELGLVARASKSASERIAENPELAGSIATVEAEKAAMVEGAKLGQQFIHKPKITEAVKLAEARAKERGEVLTSLQRSEAALPGLNSAVSELRELSQIATSTIGGKVFDAAVKQSGFGATKGASARSKFVAIINNQVLPLLKETFGSAFTVQEGESLKATMGDPDSSPEEKMVQLDAFISQKLRDIETKKIELGQQSSQAAPQSTVLRFDAQGNPIQ